MRPDQIKWLFSDDEVSSSDIAKIEEQLGVRFPEDYRECARKNHGGHPKPDVFAVGNNETIFNALLSFDSSRSIYILQVFEDISDRLPKRVFPFAADPGGNFLCFDYRQDEESPSIVYWDHEMAFLDPETGVLPVCHTFEELLTRLYDIE